MLKKCLTLGLAAAMITVGVVSDSYAVEPQNETYFQTIEKCKKAYLDLKRDNNSRLMEEYANQYKTDDMRKGFAVICLTYAIGYEDGIAGRV